MQAATTSVSSAMTSAYLPTSSSQTISNVSAGVNDVTPPISNGIIINCKSICKFTAYSL